MNPILRVNRQFERMRGPKLVLFADRIYRKSKLPSYFAFPTEDLSALHVAIVALSTALNSNHIDRKERTAYIRSLEAPVVDALQQIARYAEQKAECKSDLHALGFRPLSLTRKIRGRGIIE